MKHINLESFANGELSAQVNREMESITRNIQDPNTDAKKARKITVTITVKPNDKRDFSTISIESKSTLAPTLGAVTAMSMGKDLKTGEVEAIEVNSGQVPGQMSVAEIPGVVPESKPFDPATGEILEPAEGRKVVDMRKQA